MARQQHSVSSLQLPGGPSLRRIFLGIICLLTVLGNAGTAFSQTNTGQIKGIVRDNLGALVPGAVIAVTHIATRTKIERISNSAGEFLFPSLPVGDCEVSVSASGFKQLIKPASIYGSGKSLISNSRLRSGRSSSG
jgi:hypothetical protein